MLKGIVHVGLTVTDLDRSVAFYRDVLGLAYLGEMEMEGLEMFAALSFILIWFYNRTRGRQNKYFFYLFYPAHLLLLWLVCVAMGIAGIPAI
jgi:catechol 2,3-dioxygenase-like lactoylglutathione lyase family enzyme